MDKRKQKFSSDCERRIVLIKKIGCASCKHTSRKGCTLFKSSEEVWRNCLVNKPQQKYAYPFKILKQIKVTGWTIPMDYAYVYWESDEVVVLPDDLFEI